MKQHKHIRLLSLMLAAVLVLGLIPGASAAPGGLRWKKSRVEPVTDLSDRLIPSQIQTPDPIAPTDSVRVSIVLEDAPTLMAGYSTEGIAKNTEARAYDQALLAQQQDMAAAISRHALGGKALDVVWNLTLAANIISANVPYGALDAIEAVPGVARVYLEQSYQPEENQPVLPNTHSSSAMIGATESWESGLTGAGTRVAIIDTGTDTDHQSFDNSAFLHALEQSGQEVDLLDVGEINEVLRQLNVTERIGYDDGASYYLNEKLPFGANYVDRNLTIDHDSDNQGSHGSHVAGIAAANRFIPKNGGFLDVRDSVKMLGVAPDAQILTMKVFGNAAGPYDSDYFAAIEDAIWLGCDSINLSLGSGAPGNSSNPLAEVLEDMAATDTVVVMSAGNSGQWADATAKGHLYTDGVSFHTSGIPGTYTNSLAVASVENSETVSENGSYTMSSFSSWGVPGSLELKPEITAPGGMIYSVNGTDPSGTAYETMSGTSMAAPQVTGMAALLSQHIREQGLEQKTGLSIRHLAQSLLMSTAVPVLDPNGSYYSILNQGSGLARVDLAAKADSYILVDGMADGKVKAELGEDPRREGVYQIRFSLHDFSGKEQTYALSADLFTQLVEGLYLLPDTRTLDAAAVFSGDGVQQEAGDYNCDLNGDGRTDAADADHLLEYLLGNAATLHADGDVDADGDLDSHDAHLLLTNLSGGSYSVTVPANGSASIEVTLVLTEETRAILDSEYPTGAYIEAFVHAKPLSGGVAHSIPVLGYYGSWTEPSMYDVGRYHDHIIGQEDRTPYLYNYYLDNYTNYMSINYGDGTEYVFGGNPYALEAEYLPQRNAFNNTNGAFLQGLRYTLIRNAPATMLLVENADTGEVILSEEQGAMDSAYYYVNTGYWMNTQYRQPLGLWLNDFPEGTNLNISFIAAPELYCTYDPSLKRYTADWDRLGEGAYLTIPLTIDNTAPELLDLELVDGRYLRLKARDNHYIAAAVLYNAAGTDVLASAAANQTQRGQEMTIELDLATIYGSEFQLALYDYAENSEVYEVSLELSTVLPALTGYRIGEQGYVGLNEDGIVMPLAFARDREAAMAAEYVEGMVYEITADRKLWLGSDSDLASFTLLRELDPEERYKIVKFLDLAYSRGDKTLYTLFYSNINDMDVPYLATIDLFTGAMNVIGEMPIDVCNLTIDDEGSFYSTAFGFSRLYTYRSDVVKTKKSTLLGEVGGYKTTEVCSLAWDRDAKTLYWSVNTKDSCTLVQIDPETAAAAYVANYSFPLRGLYFRYEPDESVFAPIDRVDSVTVTPSASVLKGKTQQLTAKVLPWNVSDSSVTWTSSAPSIATVSADGTVTGVSAGVAVITAASRLDPSKKASCTVTVTELGQDLKAVIWDEEGTVWWSSFNTDSLPNYTKHSATDLPVNATMVADGQLYASTLDTTLSVSALYRVDEKTYEMTKVGDSSIAYMDMAYAPSLGYGLGVCFNYVVLIDLENGDYAGAWDWTEGTTADLVGITYCGTQWNPDYKANMDRFLLLDADGNVYEDAWLNADGSTGHFNGPTIGYRATIGDKVLPSHFQGFYYDGSYVYWTRYHEANDQVELIAWDRGGTDKVYSMGRFPEKVWPVGGLYTDADFSRSVAIANGSDLGAEIKPLSTAAIPHKVLTPMSKAETAANGTVTLDVTLPGTVANGMLEISYDPQMLQLTDVSGHTEAFAWSAEPGLVRIAAADRFPIQEPVATLHLEAIGNGSTNATVTTTEAGSEHLWLEESLSVIAGHEYVNGKCIHCGAALPSAFTDVPAGAFFFDPVKWAVEKGITAGTTPTTFDPNGNCMRAVVVTFLWRAAGSPEPTSSHNPFTDVKPSDFYYKAVLWAVEKGITSGLTATTFGPTSMCNRAQVVTFLYRAMGSPQVSKADCPFTDVNEKEFYYKPVLWAVEKRITAGLTATTFGPTAVCNRAQVVTFLYRTYNK